MGGVTPTGKIYTLVRQESLNGLHTIEFLKHLIRHVGPRLLVVWDGSPIHRRKEVKQFLASTIAALGMGVHVGAVAALRPDLNGALGSTSSMWRCEPGCAWIWRNSIWNSTWRSAA